MPKTVVGETTRTVGGREFAITVDPETGLFATTMGEKTVTSQSLDGLVRNIENHQKTNKRPKYDIEFVIFDLRSKKRIRLHYRGYHLGQKVWRFERAGGNGGMKAPIRSLGWDQRIVRKDATDEDFTRLDDLHGQIAELESQYNKLVASITTNIGLPGASPRQPTYDASADVVAEREAKMAKAIEDAINLPVIRGA